MAVTHLPLAFRVFVLGVTWIIISAGSALESPAVTGPTPNDQFRAACVKVDITPDTPQWLQGYGPRQSNGVHDRIYHRIAAMDDGTTSFFLVSTDICTISPSFFDAFCAQLKKKTNIKPEQVWWSTTHTHSAPHVGPQDMGKLFVGTLGDRFSIKHDMTYWSLVTDRLIDGIREAQSRMEPARLGIATVTAEANVNRRERRPDGRTVLGVNPNGPVDRQLGVIRLERTDGSLIGLIANYAIHGTALGGGNKQISGDVPGWAAAYVEKKIGVPMLFINGAEGNVAPLHSVGSRLDDPRLQTYDTLLGNRVLDANASIADTTANVKLSIGRTTIETALRAGLSWPDTMASYATQSPDGAQLVRIPVCSLVINDNTVIWSAPLELFSEIALNIRTASPFDNTLYFGLTNGSLLYLTTKAAFSEDGYEPNVSPFTEQAEAEFTTGVVRHLQKLDTSE